MITAIKDAPGRLPFCSIFFQMKESRASAQKKNTLCQQRLVLFLAMLSLQTARAQVEGGNTFAIYFPSGISTLSAAAQKSLDSLVYRGAVHTGQRLVITGYADEPGTIALNNSLSQRRAQAVADYLTRDGFIKKEDISAVSGRGYDAAEAGRGDNPRYRRADVSISEAPPPLPRPAPIASPPPPAPQPVQLSKPVPVPKPTPLARLDTMRANSTLSLDAVLFQNASDVVLPSSVGQLNELLRAMQANPGVHVRLEGHVCCGENGVYGINISHTRAKAVYDYLIRNGIAKNRLDFQGFGFTRPLIYPEMSEEDRRLNRRVEVRIISKR